MRLTVRRSALIVARARIAGVLFGGLFLLWTIADYWVSTGAMGNTLLPARLAAAVVCAAIVLGARGGHTLRQAYLALGVVYAVIGAYILFVHFGLPLAEVSRAVRRAALPDTLLFVVTATICLFPLTLFEAALFASVIPAFLMTMSFATSAGADASLSLTDVASLLAVAAVAVLAALSQLTSLLVIQREGMYDALTGGYSRRCGEDLISLHYTWASRTAGRLAVALVELDGFRQANAAFGYELGNATLEKAAQNLHDSMRSGDSLVRWAGDQFLLILPMASLDQATVALHRFLAAGLGVRPDGAPLTASIGIAECTRDAPRDWWTLVDLAEARMRVAGQQGGNCTVVK